MTSPFSALRLSGRLMVIQNACPRFSCTTLLSVIACSLRLARKSHLRPKSLIPQARSDAGAGRNKNHNGIKYLRADFGATNVLQLGRAGAENDVGQTSSIAHANARAIPRITVANRPRDSMQ